MICPLCNLELKHSMIVLNLNEKGIKEFHLQHAHKQHLMNDALELIRNLASAHKDSERGIPFGDTAVELQTYAHEIALAETEKWEGEEN